MQESEGSSLEELVPSNLSLKDFSLDCSCAKILSHRKFFDWLSIVTNLSSLEKCIVELSELSEGGMLLYVILNEIIMYVVDSVCY